MALTSFGHNVKDALQLSFENAQKIRYNGKYFRSDIGFEFL